jgi:hypothetical protein
MDSAYRLRIKIGAHEFDAEGAAEVVQAQFEAFKQLVATATPLAREPGRFAENGGGDGGGSKRDLATVDSALGEIMKLDNRVVSFTVPPTSIDDAILLLLYGQKTLRQNDSVSGAEIMGGLQTTGGLGVRRVDGYLEKAARAGTGTVIVTGEGRAKRYRLTNTGLAKARELAAELIAKVA